MTARRYAAPPYARLTPLMPSQQSSFRSTRTKLMCQDAIAATEAALFGPSNSPQPWMQAYSVPERLTPCRATGCPLASRSRLPETCSPRACAAAGSASSRMITAAVRLIRLMAATFAVPWEITPTWWSKSPTLGPDPLTGAPELDRRDLFLFGDPERRTAAAGRDHVRVVHLETGALETVDEVDRRALDVGKAGSVHQQADPLVLEHPVAVPLLVEGQRILKAATASAPHA